MNRIDVIEKIQKMLVLSRTKAGKSQEYMAKALNASRAMVQKWESGTSPIQLIKVIEWFSVLDVPAMPYVWSLLFESLDGVSDTEDDTKIEEGLIDAVKGLSPDAKRKLLYLILGEHGSPSAATLELFVAYLRLDIREKLDVANLIRLDYYIAKEKGHLEEGIEPDLGLLDQALQNAFKAVTNSQKSYTIAAGLKNER